MRLFLYAFVELIRYDFVSKRKGFRSVCESVERISQSSRQPPPSISVAAICDAVNSAISLYWRPVHCFQRSAAAARMLKHFGFPASLVIGYHPYPFKSHAWVEVSGNVVNDTGEHKDMLILTRI